MVFLIGASLSLVASLVALLYSRVMEGVGLSGSIAWWRGSRCSQPAGQERFCCIGQLLIRLCSNLVCRFDRSGSTPLSTVPYQSRANNDAPNGKVFLGPGLAGIHQVVNNV